MKKLLACMLVGAMSLMLVTGCGDDAGSTGASQSPVAQPIAQPIQPDPTPSQSVTEDPGTAATEEPVVEAEPVPAGMYRSELTNEPISESLASQRPIAVMVDNEKTALDHYGVNQADIVYEMMNSTANDRVTRLMCIIKDWNKIERLGSIRSTRPTNILLAAEWNAILIHDGGPFYIDEYLKKKYTNNLSSGFARFDNGKAWEFREYVTSEAYNGVTLNGGTTMYDGLGTRIEKAKFSTTYNDYYTGKHFRFSDVKQTLDNASGVRSANSVDLAAAFKHNASRLDYNDSTGLYEYAEYGKKHIDALTGEVTGFTNVILQKADYYVYDEHGYLLYYIFSDHYADSKGEGYYMTGGKAVPIYWTKAGNPDTIANTQYFNAQTGEEIVFNTGKT